MPVIETIRLVAAALRHPSYGVNAQLAVYARDATDDRPPVIKGVYEETSDSAAARDGLYPEWPILVVTADGPVHSVGEPGLDGKHRDSEVPLAIRYVTGTAEPQIKRRDTYYTLNAIIRCLDALTNPSTPQEHRELNTVCIQSKEEVWYGGIAEKIEDVPGTLLAGAVVVTFNVRDEW
jgi:hypothetical protein